MGSQQKIEVISCIRQKQTVTIKLTFEEAIALHNSTYSSSSKLFNRVKEKLRNCLEQEGVGRTGEVFVGGV